MANGQNIKIKNMKTYIEDDYPVAYSKARKELGPDLIIVEKKDIKIGGIFGLFTKKKIKVTFGVEASPPKPKQTKKENNNNQELLDLLKKMGYNKEEENKLDSGINTPDSTGTYKPYNMNAKKPETIKQEKETPKEENIEGLKDKIKQELAEELKKEFFKEGPNFQECEAYNTGKWKKLRENDIEDEVIEEIERYLKENNYTEENEIEGLRNYFLENIEVTGGNENNKFVMLVGPTGVGKTTSCAKIVANRWRDEDEVAFITADTYRLEAVSQLKAYANIMKVPIEVIKKPEELHSAIEKFKEKDFVVMDTAGRSPKNKEQMEELKNFIRVKGSEISIYLVLSATSKLSVLYDTIEKFKYIGFSSIIFTKIDETTSIGALLSIYKKYKIPVSYITTGQRVPDDIEIATKERLTDTIIEGLK